jgi:caffeoyl-CoA O-methyltransferase
MRYLETRDALDRKDDTPHINRLRQIPRETGQFIALLAADAPPGEIVEIGTSAGYSTLWLALACLESDRALTTIELLDEKVAMAQETFRMAGVSDRVNLHHGDALTLIRDFDQIAFCFLDSEKRDYANLYELIVPRLVPGGLLVADNVISHREMLSPVIERAGADERVDCVVVPIGKGELLCRRVANNGQRSAADDISVPRS